MSSQWFRDIMAGKPERHNKRTATGALFGLPAAVLLWEVYRVNGEVRLDVPDGELFEVAMPDDVPRDLLRELKNNAAGILWAFDVEVVA